MNKVKSPKANKVFVGLSGGVDSSVTAALLKERGFDVTGVYIKCYNVDGCSETDAEDARRVAEQLDIPFYAFDFEEEYKARVVEYMVDGYKIGITPNPDVMCNKEIKFGLFLKKALELGADYVATGHYVRIKENNNKTFSLLAAVDDNKDQSYFLWTLTQEQLKHCLFPIGEYVKPQVRELAKKYRLLTADKKDSQGICFLGKVSIADFLKKYIPEKPGDVLNAKGQIIGRHKGAYFYTIGQRQGLDSGNWKRSKKGDSEPLYVVSKDVIKNTITVVEGDSDPTLFRKEVILANVNIINPNIVPEPVEGLPKLEIGNWKLEISVLARVRYRQPLAKATLYQLPTTNYKLIFDVPQQYVADGQSAVFYSDDGEMLGGGVIIG